MAKVRFVHAGADVPAVDIAVAGGPMVFSNVGFEDTAGPIQVPAGTYSLEVRAAGTNTVLLLLPSVALTDGQIVTLFGAGLRSDRTFTVVELPYPAASGQPTATNAPFTVNPTTPVVTVAAPTATGSGGLLRRDASETRWLLLTGLLLLGVAGYGWRLSR
jgi:hypothetical protein